VMFRPVQEPHPPILIGGYGARRTPELTARFAAEFNVPAATLEPTAQQYARVDAACEAIGRDPASVIRSVWVTACIGRDETEFNVRAAAIGRDPAEIREHGLAGTPAEARATLGRFKEIGVSRVYLQFLDVDDLDHLDLAIEVLGDA